MKTILLYIFAALISLPAIAQTKGPAETKDDPYGVKIYTLNNGLTVMLSVNKNAPRIQTMIAIKAGSRNDPPDNTGLAHYLEHMLFKGTELYGTKSYGAEKGYLHKIEAFYKQYAQTDDSAQRAKIYKLIDTLSYQASQIAIANEYDRMMQSIGATGTNAFTTNDQTVYINDIPANQLEQWLKIEGNRFEMPVFRLFHTELEAVYEEKNRSLDNDDSKAIEALLKGVFPTHPYGLQTTIGTVEHLKNPSLEKIKEFYNLHYKAANMAIIMSGDFDPDEVILQIEKNFGSLGRGNTTAPFLLKDSVQLFNHAPNQEFTVIGPKEEKLFMGFPVGSAASSDALKLYMTDMILANSQAGLLDIDLNKAQKVQYAVCSPWLMDDFSLHYFIAYPREGQSLEECKKLVLDELEKLKRGEFDESIMKAIVENMRLDRAKNFTDNYSRCDKMMEAFVFGYNWSDYTTMPERLEKLTKQDIIDFAKRTYTPEKLTVVYKKTGKDTSIQKVPKPKITPIETNRDAQSHFARNIEALPVNPISPVFPDFETDILTTTKGRWGKKVKVEYVKNKQTDYFTLYIRFEMGKRNNPMLTHVADYMTYIATSTKTNEQISREFFNIACEFGFRVNDDNSYIYLQGLNKNFDAAYTLLLEIFNDAKVTEEKWQNLVSDILKSREDNKTNKNIILHQALGNYARYGKDNPFTYIVPAEKLKNTKAAEIEDAIKKLLRFRHQVWYYGPSTNDEIIGKITQLVKPSKRLKKTPKEKKFKAVDPKKPIIYFVPYDMVQAEVTWSRPMSGFKPTQIPTATVFNEYFGSGMYSLVFQTIRESKALAYSSYAFINHPSEQKQPGFATAYVGTQSDKLVNAMKGMQALMDSLPAGMLTGDLARQGVRKQIESERTTGKDLLFTWQQAQELGLKKSVNQLIYENLTQADAEQLKAMQKEAYAGQTFAICIIASKDRINPDDLKQFGEVRQLTLEEVFGY